MNKAEHRAKEGANDGADRHGFQPVIQPGTYTHRNCHLHPDLADLKNSDGIALISLGRLLHLVSVYDGARLRR